MSVRPAYHTPLSSVIIRGDQQLAAVQPLRFANINVFARLRIPVWLVRDVAVPYALTRLFLILVGIYLPSALALSANDNAANLSSQPWLNAWSRWDSGWYISIVQHGYSYTAQDKSNLAFWPLLPAMMKLGGLVSNHDTIDGWLLSGLIASNIALLAGVIYICALVRLDLGARTATRTVLCMLVSPTSFFLSAVYPESLFLGSSAAAFYYARQRRWWLVGILGAAATLSRPHGVLIFVPLAVEYVAHRGISGVRFRREILSLGLIPTAFLGWAACLYALSGRPLMVLQAGAAWGRQLVPPWQMLGSFFSEPLVFQPGEHSLFDLCFAIAFVLLVIVCWRVVRPVYALYASLLLAAMLSSGMLISIPRYGLVLFPVFVVLGVAAANRVFKYVYIVSSLALAAYFMEGFAQGFWVA